MVTMDASADAAPSEMMYTWQSEREGVLMRVPLHWEIKDLKLETRASLPSFPPCIIFYDKYGYITPDDATKVTSGDEGGGGSGGYEAGDGLLELSPRSISIAVHPADSTTDVRALCKACLRDALSIEDVKEVDGVDNLREVSVGRKARTPLQLCGRPAFRFSFSAHGSEWEGYHVLGVVDGARAVVVTVNTTSEDVYETLPEYTETLLEPHLRQPQNLRLMDPAPPREEEPEDEEGVFDRVQASGMTAKWDLGVVTYRNATAAFAFSLPAYPLQFKIGSSIIMANARQNVFNLTMVLKMLPPADPTAEDDIDQYSRSQQPVEISLGIDIEDIVRAHKSTIMSAAEYGSTKLKSIMSEFTNTKPSGTPLTNYIGNRSGVSYLWTGHLSTAMSSKFYKAMCCVTLNSNKGIVVSYFTRTGQGLFDMNLHIMQDLLKDIYFIPEREADGAFDLHEAVSVRLTSRDDFDPTFTNKPAQLNRYVYLAGCSTNGTVNGFHGAPVAVTADGIEDDGQEQAGRKKKDRAKQKTVAAAEMEETDSVIDVSDIAWIQKAFVRYDEYVDEEGGLQEGEGAEASAAEEEEVEEETEAPQATTGVDGEAGAEGEGEEGVGSDAGAAEDEAGDDEGAPDASSPHSVHTDGEDGDEITGVSLQQIYLKACARRGVKANSRFLSILPQDALYDTSLHDLDLSLNYFGKGFAAVLYLFKFTPNLHSIAFNNMSLTNDDIVALCDACAHLPKLRALELTHNPHVSLQAARPLINLVRRTPTLQRVDLSSTAMGPDVVGLINAELAKNTGEA